MGNCIITRRNFDQGGNPPVSIVSWANGTDTEIKAMIDAADAGSITLSDYWSVGDRRTVTLSAISAGNVFQSAMSSQSIYLVLMDTGSNSKYRLYNNYSKYVNFVAGQTNCLTSKGRMNTTNTNSGGWSDSAMRTALNDAYYNAYPSTLKSCLKRFVSVCAKDKGATETIGTPDYASLFASKEIFGASVPNSNEYENSDLRLIAYHSTISRRNRTSADSNFYYRTRSVNNINSNFLVVRCFSGTDPTSYTNNSATYYYIPPFVCI